MGRLTRVQKTILMAVGTVGAYRSLSRLTDELDLNYSHAYHMVKDLQAQGLLTVSRPRKDLILSLPAGDETY